MTQSSTNTGSLFNVLFIPVLLGGGGGMFLGMMNNTLNDFRLPYYWDAVGIGLFLFSIIYLIRDRQGATLSSQQMLVLPVSLIVMVLAIPVMLTLASGELAAREHISTLLSEHVYAGWLLTSFPVLFGAAAGFAGQKHADVT